MDSSEGRTFDIEFRFGLLRGRKDGFLRSDLIFDQTVSGERRAKADYLFSKIVDMITEYRENL